MPQTLFTPGPTPVPDAVLQRMAQPIIHHRSAEAQSIFRTVQPQLQKVFGTTQPVLILSSSGTGAIEAAMCTLGQPGLKAMVLNNGKFAQRWVDMLRTFGYSVVDANIPWSNPATPEILEPLLKEHPDCAQVWMVHSETSTGTYSDIQALAHCVHEHSNALVCVDSISSMCAHEIQMDNWGLDVVATGSQKGFMLPPGLAFISLSERAWKAAELATLPCYYFDLRKARVTALQNTSPWTPAISLICGLEVSLQMILNEGLEAMWSRHTQLSLQLRTSVLASGYALYSTSPSHAVTALYIPEHIPDLVQRLLQDFSIRVASGQDQLKGRILRVGHLGYYTAEDIIFVAGALSSYMH